MSLFPASYSVNIASMAKYIKEDVARLSRRSIASDFL
jgi:hypothetical protein